MQDGSVGSVGPVGPVGPVNSVNSVGSVSSVATLDTSGAVGTSCGCATVGWRSTGGSISSRPSGQSAGRATRAPAHGIPEEPIRQESIGEEPIRQEPTKGNPKYGVWPQVMKAVIPRLPGASTRVQSEVDFES